MNKPYPEYVDLSLFNFPPHIDPSILLNLKINCPVELEVGLQVVRKVSSIPGKESIVFYRRSRDYTNPYGPSEISSLGYIGYKLIDKFHRLDGPALINNNRVGFYLKGVHYKSELEYWIAVEKYKKEYTNE